MSNNSIIRSRFIRAFEKARSLGEVIGFVSRKVTSRIGEEGNSTVIEVDADTYYKFGDFFGVGNYLVGVDIRSGRAVGLRIVSVSRADIISSIEPYHIVPFRPDEEGLDVPTYLTVETLLDEGGIPFTMPLEPQSPVVIPKNPEIICRVIGLPEAGIPLGALHTGSHLVSGGKVKLKLPRHEFFKHVLVIGTTGSGKTTFLKNLIYVLLKEWVEAKTLIVDAAGDYAQIVLPPLNKEKNCPLIESVEENYLRRIKVLVPIRRDDKDVKAFAASYVGERLGRIVRTFFKDNLEIGVKDGEFFGGPPSVVVEGCIRGECFEVNVIPISPSYVQLKDHLEIFPLFSRQAKVYLKNIVNYLEDVEGGISNFTHLYRALEANFTQLINDLKLHRRTLENIERAINFIASADEIDASVNRKPVGMPDLSLLMSNLREPLILDLDYSAMRGSHYLTLNLITYELLRDLYAWKKAGEGFTIPTLVILDEAHRFFPSEGTSKEEVEILADFISRIARLGRARGLGLIFSTHSPKDVHKIVLQLTNTKIVFRSEKEFLELLDVPQELFKLLELVPDRIGMVRSSSIRVGHSMFMTCAPLLGHFDLGRLSWTKG